MKVGTHDEIKDFIDAVRRDRVLRGAAKVVATKGYAATKISDLVRAGRCARKTFYELFGHNGRNDCLVGVVELAGDEVLRHVVGAVEETTPSERLRGGIDALLGFVAEEPALARVFLIDGPALAPDVLEGVRREFDGMLSAKPGIHEDLVVGSIESVLYRHVVEKATDSPQYLAPFLTELVLKTRQGAEDPAPVHSIASLPPSEVAA